nr:N-acetylmuramoyl-L-alanine amidase [Thiocystis violacea]
MLIISLPAAGSQVAVECSGVTTDSEKTRLVLDTASTISHQIFTLDGPDRVVIDIPDATLTGALPEARADDRTLIGLRSGLRETGDLRIVLDLKHPVRVKSFTTAEGGRYGHRLIIDLLPVGAASTTRTERAVEVDTESDQAPLRRSSRSRTAIVAIDAGHGGEDPGALGQQGTREKDVTLAIARKLARLVEKEPGMRVVMIRDDDSFVALRERIARARKSEADLFVSIHADAFNTPDAHGSSVYTLSQGSASSEAANWLADRENSADLVGGVDLSDGDELLASVLIDMSYNATIEHSAEAANSVLGHLKKLGDVHKGDVQRAGFVVLKSHDVPSILVETAFISNMEEERRLRSSAHQQRLAQAILAGIKTYFRKYPPQGYLSAGTGSGLDAITRPSRAPKERVAASREHVISRGDTLSEIAKRYRVSVSSLRAENGLGEGDYIRVGEVLSIPAGS